MTTRVNWPAEQTAALQSLIADKLDYVAAAAALNARFGTSRSRKACSCHIYGLDHRLPSGPRKSWPPEHDDFLKQLLAGGNSYSEASAAINERFGSAYTKNSCIGRGRRISVGTRGEAPRAYACSEQQKAAAVRRKREKRWAADPSLEARYARLQELKKNRAMFVASGATRTSAGYRIHMPRLPANLTRGDLRAMIAQAVRNTAAMEIAP